MFISYKKTVLLMSIFIPKITSSGGGGASEEQILIINNKNKVQDEEIINLGIANGTQDTRLTTIETVNSTQDTTLFNLETTNTAQTTKITALEVAPYFRYRDTAPVNQNPKDSYLDSLNNIYSNSDKGFPQQSSLPTYYTGTTHEVSTEVEFDTALLAAFDYDIIRITSAFSLSTTKTISKRLKITSTFNGLTLTSSATLNAFNITVGEVFFDTVGLANNNAGSSANILNFTNTSATKNFVHNCILSTNEFAISSNNMDIQITNNSFRFNGLADSHRYIILTGGLGNVFISNNEFWGNSGFSTQCININNSVASAFLNGNLIIRNNTSQVNAVQRLLMVDIPMSGSNYSIYASNNVIDCTSGFMIFYNLPLSGIKQIYVINNTENNTQASNISKGLIGIDSPSNSVIDFTTLIYSANNTVGLLRADYADLGNILAVQPRVVGYAYAKFNVGTQRYDLIVPFVSNITSALKSKVDSATALNEVSTLVARDSVGKSAFSSVQTDNVESISSSLNIGGSTGTSTVNLGCGSGVQTVNIGTVGGGVTTINIGGSGDTVSVAGTLTTVNTTNLDVVDKLIRLNKGNGASSGFGSGIELEENNVATGYIKTSNDRNSWLCKAPNGTEFTLGQSVGEPLAIPNTLVGRDATGSSAFNYITTKLPDDSQATYGANAISSNTSQFQIISAPTTNVLSEVNLTFSDDSNIRGLQIANKRSSCNLRFSSTSTELGVEYTKTGRIRLETNESQKFGADNTTEFHFMDNNGSKTFRLGNVRSRIEGFLYTNAIISQTLYVNDKLIKLNRANGANTGFGSGIEIEENNIATGYIKTSVDGSTWVCKAPNGTEFTLGGGGSGDTTATPLSLAQRDSSSRLVASSFIGNAINSTAGNTCSVVGNCNDGTAQMIAEVNNSQGRYGIQVKNNTGNVSDIQLSGADGAIGILRYERRSGFKQNENNASEWLLGQGAQIALYAGVTQCGVTSPFRCPSLNVGGIDRTPTDYSVSGTWTGPRTSAFTILRFQKIGDTVFYAFPPIGQTNANNTQDFFVFSTLAHPDITPSATAGRCLNMCSVWNSNQPWSIGFVAMLSSREITVQMANGGIWYSGQSSGWSTTLTGCFRLAV